MCFVFVIAGPFLNPFGSMLFLSLEHMEDGNAQSFLHSELSHDKQKHAISPLLVTDTMPIYSFLWGKYGEADPVTQMNLI